MRNIHPIPVGRLPASLGCRVMRFNRLVHFLPGNDLIPFFKEKFFPGFLSVFPEAFCGKALLTHGVSQKL